MARKNPRTAKLQEALKPAAAEAPAEQLAQAAALRKAIAALRGGAAHKPATPREFTDAAAGATKAARPKPAAKRKR